MDEFLSYFANAQLPQWRDWYFDLEAPSRVSERFVRGSQQTRSGSNGDRPSSAQRRDSTRSTTAPHGDTPQEPFGSPPPGPNLEITEEHTKALMQLRSRGAKVRVSTDFWLDVAAAIQTENYSGDEAVAPPRDRANCNLNIFPRKVRIILRGTSEAATTPSVAVPLPSFALHYGSNTPSVDSPVDIDRLVREGLAVTATLWPRRINGVPLDLAKIRQTRAAAEDLNGSINQPYDQLVPQDSLVDIQPASASEPLVLGSVERASGLWVVKTDTALPGAAPESSELLSVRLDVLGLIDVLEQLAQGYAVLSQLITRELRKVSRFYSRQAAVVSGSVVACVEMSKAADHQTDRERSKMAPAFRDTYSALESLQQFRELNYVAVIRFVDNLEQLTQHDIRTSLGGQLRRVNFIAKNNNSKTAVATLRDLLIDAARQYCPEGTMPEQWLTAGTDPSEAYLKSRARFNAQIAALTSVSAVFLLVTAVDYFDTPQPVVLNNHGMALVSYHYVLSMSLIFLYAEIAFMVEVLEQVGVNYVFLLDVDAVNHWTGRELVRDVMVYVALWFACLYGFMRTARAELRGDPGSSWSWAWAYIMWVVLITVWILYQIFHPPARKRWFLPSLWRTVTAPVRPIVSFQDNVTGLILMSASYVLQSMQTLYCSFLIPGLEDFCSAQSDMDLFILATLPPFLRISQSINCYFAPLPHRRSAFPHLFNAGKYFTGIVLGWMMSGAKIRQYYAPNDKVTYDAFYSLYIILSTGNATFRVCWDVLVNGGFKPLVNVFDADRVRHERMASLFGTDAVARDDDIHLRALCENDDEHCVSSPIHVAALRVVHPETSESSSTTQPDRSLPADPVHVEEHFGYMFGLTWWPIRRRLLPVWFYVIVYVWDFFARFDYIVGLAFTKNVLWMSLFYSGMECMRRFLILVARVESEQVTNVESYKVTVAAPPAALLGAGTGKGLLSTSAWDAAACELAINNPIADVHRTRKVAFKDTSQVDRFFSLLPETEKVALTELARSYLPSARRFDGRAGEGKSQWFAERPEDIKIAVLLQRAGSRPLARYVQQFNASSGAQ